MGKWDELQHEFYQSQIDSCFFFFKNKIVDSLDWDITDDLSYLSLSREYRTQIKLLCKLDITGRNLRSLRWLQSWLKGRLQ